MAKLCGNNKTDNLTAWKHNDELNCHTIIVSKFITATTCIFC